MLKVIQPLSGKSRIHRQFDSKAWAFGHYTAFSLHTGMHAKSLQSCPTLCDPMDCSLPGSSVHGDSPDKNTGVSCPALPQRIFPTQGSNPGLPHCRQILYHLSHQGSPRILEWVAYPFSRGASRPRDQTMVSRTAGGFFTS